MVASELSESTACIRVRGARAHNLRNLSVDIPLDALTVVTGPSGSGKSSLARDTLFVEGRRQFLETLSPRMRRHVGELERPDVDSVEGLPPTVIIDQRRGAPNPRGTLGTLTEIHDFLRLLYARLGQMACPSCGLTILRFSPDEIVAKVMAMPEGKRAMLLAPMGRHAPDRVPTVLEEVRRAGFVRIRVEGVVQDLDQPLAGLVGAMPEIDAVVDRIVVRPAAASRIGDSIRAALDLGKGTLIVCEETPGGSWQDHVYLTGGVCPRCGRPLPRPEPRLFSFNSPEGACPACQGMGQRDGLVCGECGGARLRAEARACRVGGLGIHEACGRSVSDLIAFLQSLTFPPAEAPIADKIVPEILRRLDFLRELGLEYLSLDRTADSLSGGELQRARLTTSLGSGLAGACYVLDEPSVGLHPRDTDRLIGALCRLRRQGNSVLVVEHDEALIRAADHVIDMGPSAGRAGGMIVAQGPIDAILRAEESATGRYLAGTRTRTRRQTRRAVKPQEGIWLRGARANNLRNLDVAFPLGALTCVTGVSGSGKSSLVIDTLCVELGRRLHGRTSPPAPVAEVTGWDRVARLVEVAQTPLGRNRRATPATYTGVLDAIRPLFAATREARQRGLTAARFSYGDRGGRCSRCRGLGEITVAMDFLPAEAEPCPACQGRRYGEAILQIRFRGQNIADVLSMTVDEAAAFFGEHFTAASALASLRRVGLGYLLLGQSLATLSGGEAQRLKLAAELARGDFAGPALFVLDEPTTGLHFEDVRRLLDVLQALVDEGHTLVVIEHHLDVIAEADWVIDLGPEGGTRGGEIVFQGPPDQLASASRGHTAQCLKAWLDRHQETADCGP